MIIENDNHRKGLLDALKTKSTPIIVKGIFEGAEIEEESYNTYALTIDDNSPKLILGDESTAKEDYLTTLRNSVGQPGPRIMEFFTSCQRVYYRRL